MQKLEQSWMIILHRERRKLSPEKRDWNILKRVFRLKMDVSVVDCVTGVLIAEMDHLDISGINMVCRRCLPMHRPRLVAHKILTAKSQSCRAAKFLQILHQRKLSFEPKSLLAKYRAKYLKSFPDGSVSKLPSAAERKYLANQVMNGNECFTCKKCLLTFKLRYKAFKHIRTEHGLPEKIVLATSIADMERKYLISNVRVKNRRFFCNICSSSYCSRHRAIEHIRKFHGVPDCKNSADR